MTKSQVIIEQFISKALEGNPLGDPAIRRVPVYLPPGYEEGDAHYPVVFLLTAFAARGLKLLNDNLWEENIQERMDRLIEEERVSPMIIVFLKQRPQFYLGGHPVKVVFRACYRRNNLHAAGGLRLQILLFDSGGRCKNPQRVYHLPANVTVGVDGRDNGPRLAWPELKHVGIKGGGIIVAADHTQVNRYGHIALVDNEKVDRVFFSRDNIIGGLKNS